MDKKVIAIAVVAVLVAAGIGAGLIIANKDKDDKSVANYAGDVKIYGNANNDTTIDNKDVEVLEKIIKDNNYDVKTYPYADANQDGKITDADVQIVKRIINGETTVINYVNYFGDVRQVHYPVTGTFGVNFWQQAEIMAILGLWERVAATDSSTITRTSQYPGIDKCFDLGSRDAMTSEKILASGISALICHGNSSSTTEQLITDFEKSGKTIDIICLGWEGMNCLSTALMLGIMFQCEEKAHTYVDWCNGILDKIKTKIATLSDDQKVTMVVNLMYATQSNNIKIECEGTGSYSLLSQIADVLDLEEATYATKNRATKSAEWFISENEKGTFNYIMIMEEGTGLSATPQSYNERFEYSLTFLNQTKAYSEGKIGATTYGFGGFSGFGLLLYAAYQVYPQLFNAEDGIKCMQDWYDNFTFMTIDANSFGWHYSGTAYTQYNDRIANA